MDKYAYSGGQVNVAAEECQHPVDPAIGYQPPPPQPPQYGYTSSPPVQAQPNYGGGGGVQSSQQQQQTVVVVTNQPQATSFMQGQPQNIRDWSHGLCDCCADFCQCAYAYFCWCCFLGSLASRMDENGCGPFCCGSWFLVPMRTKIRTQYGIRGSICGDLCTVSCCPFCAALQMSNELRHVGR
jgi:Cys-rich protein (TIGR01571 family)